MADRIVAITGASGQLGRDCAARFERLGWTVLRLGRATPRAPTDRLFHLGEPLPPGMLRGVDALVHCAYDFTATRAGDVHRLNAEGSRLLFEAARAEGVGRVVFVSSISAFDGCRSLYGRAKLAAEAHARRAGAVVIRPALIVGSPPGGVFAALLRSARHAPVVPLVDGGRQVQYVVARDDLVEFIVRCCDARALPVAEPITVAHPKPWTMRELLAELASRGGRRPMFVPVPGRFVWAVLRAAEAARLPLGLRSDSVISLQYQNPFPDFEAAERAGFRSRDDVLASITDWNPPSGRS